ncbi:cupin domain-containing protein [Sulfurimonas sp. MAG313]|nr:cupin domain-containing protein [Sulfurimonas sp. MAG313]MDF1881515.1 cupin domain-containing protein [Sulfurimonas sp. MAG313]
MKLFKLQEDLNFTNTAKITSMGETPFSKEIRICMGVDALMKEHKAPAPITIELFSGSIELKSENDTHIMQEGEIAVFEANIAHSLFALKNSIIRLSLSKSDTIQRVQNLILKG